MFRITCPSCKRKLSVHDLKGGVKRKVDPRWYEVSHSYTASTCPNCGTWLKISHKTWIEAVTVFILFMAGLYLIPNQTLRLAWTALCVACLLVVGWRTEYVEDQSQE